MSSTTLFLHQELGCRIAISIIMPNLGYTNTLPDDTVLRLLLTLPLRFPMNEASDTTYSFVQVGLSYLLQRKNSLS